MTTTESEMTINDTETGLNQDTLDDLMRRVETQGVDILGPNGVLT